MKCCIELLFDKESQKRLSDLRKILKDNGIHDEAVPTNHISIADLECGDVEKLKAITKTFAITHNTINITLSSCGSFMTPENVLFMSPTINEDLLKYNEDITKMLEDNGIEVTKYYKKNNWVPHCTLAIRLSNSELKKGFAILKDNNIIPLTVTCDRVDVLDYTNKPNYNQLAIYELNDQIKGEHEMKIYLSHSSNYYYINKIYEPIKKPDLIYSNTFFFPHDNKEVSNTKEIIPNYDLLIAEVSLPTTGQGIEMGWADSFNVPILCVYEKGAKISSALKLITDQFIEYDNPLDMITKISNYIENRNRQ